MIAIKYRKYFQIAIISIVWGVGISYILLYIYFTLEWLIPLIKYLYNNYNNDNWVRPLVLAGKKYLLIVIGAAIFIPFFISVSVINYLFRPLLNKLIFQLKLLTKETISYKEFNNKYIIFEKGFGIYLRSFVTDISLNKILEDKPFSVNFNNWEETLDDNLQMPLGIYNNKLNRYFKLFKNKLPLFACKNIDEKNEYIGINEIQIPLEDWDIYIRNILEKTEIILIHGENKITKGFIWECETVKKSCAPEKIVLISGISKRYISESPISKIFGLSADDYEKYGKDIFFTFDVDWLPHKHSSLTDAIKFKLGRMGTNKTYR